MSGARCKSLIDCTGTDQLIMFHVIRFGGPDVIEHTGYLYEVDKTRLLIAVELIGGNDTLNAFITLNQTRENQYKAWVADDMKKKEFIAMNKQNSDDYAYWQETYVDFDS